MSTKRIVLLLVLSVIALIFVLKTGITKIQSVAIDLEFNDEPVIAQQLAETVDKLNENMNEQILDHKLEAIRVLLVDHDSKQAVYWHEGISKSVTYDALDKSMITGNQYRAYFDGEPLLVINADPIIGDAFERVIVSYIHYIYADMSKLQPSQVNYFEQMDEDVYERYYRHELIDSLYRAYEEDDHALEDVSYIYNEWKMHVGEAYLSIMAYDMYEGLEYYLSFRVRQMSVPSYDLEQYLSEYRCESGSVYKHIEFGLIGMLMYLNGEKYGIDMLEHDAMRPDRFKQLLDGIPYTSDYSGMTFENFEMSYKNHLDELKDYFENATTIIDEFESRPLAINAEYYDSVIKMPENHYIYTDYKGKMIDGTVIEQQIMVVEITPYSVLYYYE